MSGRRDGNVERKKRESVCEGEEREINGREPKVSVLVCWQVHSGVLRSEGLLFRRCHGEACSQR